MREKKITKHFKVFLAFPILNEKLNSFNYVFANILDDITNIAVIIDLFYLRTTT